MDEIVIGNIKFTPDKRILNKGGVVVKMRNKESEVLHLLCHHYPSTLSREDLEKEIWGDSYVTDNTLTQTISNLRHALDDKDHELVMTIPKKGYCISTQPILTSSDSSQNLILSEDESTRNFVSEFIILMPKGINNFYKTSVVLLLVVCCIASFSLTSIHHQIKINDVGSLPILIGLDATSDSDFLLKFNKKPYIFLKKRSDGEYIACKYNEGELICEKK
ncbi:transcriptional regulator [Yersinia massiliensis]|jgi:DNA-binding winged helix-turn-helix (wHTH) protein|uniref:Transcriptional regulator n=3 Tax=Yersinia TaxID=629 RepID=A0A2R4NLJ8_9GAMM|nr:MULTISPECIES: transcriptional regulator [Yersinia]HEC1649991.1 transcriptional regulator [Yersinia enterocolitica]ATM87207.1 transcriptional regulator [Yersinia frederiksenii]AVX36994.1 transcriptional regulator [Yersinia massiliensis]MCB5317990.1 transcriptional regulator [Yersinia massiliensis]MDA5549557.1 transcriptional regulator [Yersinia massiliensis]